MPVTAYDTTSVAVSFVPLLRTTTITGSTVDLAVNGGGDAGAVVHLNVGAITDGTHTLSIEESADDSSWGTVAAGDLNGTPGALVAATAVKIGYKGTKRYIRAKVTVTGSPSTGGTYGAIVVRGRPRSIPQTGLT